MSFIDSQASAPSRHSVIDALRGFALFGLFLVHIEEHYNLFDFPSATQSWLVALDSSIPKVVYFLFGGKSYAIFAFFFGLSFFIQMDRQSQKGVDFSFRFAWRLLILFFIGFLHGLVYSGDILTFFATTGLSLILLYRWPSKLLWAIATLLLLQIPMILDLAHTATDPRHRLLNLFDEMMTLYNDSQPIYKGSKIGEVLSYNWFLGKKASWLYMFLYGRVYQTLGLFILGILVGRSRVFENITLHTKAIRKLLIAAIIAFVPLYTLQLLWFQEANGLPMKEMGGAVIASYANLALGTALCTSFILLYQHTASHSFWKSLSAVGRMSLSNYVLQSLVLVPLLFGFGLGLYDDLGTTWSFVLGLVVFALQVAFSKWWMQRHHYGPLEWLWRSATFLKKDIPFRKT